MLTSEEKQTLLSLPSWHELLYLIKRVTNREQTSTVAGLPRAEYYRRWTRRRDRAKAFGRSPG
jgi:hypothetical protein